MFKVLVLQALYNLSDDQAEFQIRDRLSFLRFLGLTPNAPSPDAKTIWLFREHLVQARSIEQLFALFDARLKACGYLAQGGQIIDATVIAAPRQHMTDEEKALIKEGKAAEEIWPDESAKASQKDIDARWTMKRGSLKRSETGEARAAVPAQIMVPMFGYKNHAGIDRTFGFIRKWAVTHAARHDSGAFEDVLDTGNIAQSVWADTAYRSAKNEAAIRRARLKSMIHFRKPKGKPMDRRHQRANAARSKVRSVVEHVFATQKSRMALFVRTIGIERARMKIGMANLAYKFKRLVWHEGRTAPA
ncbi:transposase [Sphingobium sp. B2]|uniref:transposase n=1 Tax=Sphingobium sp. B2 TaxID=2583228 RepID=UPI0011A56FDA|nr:transposase [Sphingobium sp. B2]